MRMSVVIGLLAFSVPSGSALANKGQIFTPKPPQPAISATSTNAARAASASQSKYVSPLGLHSRARTTATEKREIANATNSLGPIRLAADEPGWPMRGNDPANSGHTAALGPAAQTQPAWSFQPDPNTFVWRPAVAPDGTIYVTTVSFPPSGVDGRLYALRPDGSVKWHAQLTNSSGANIWASVTPVLDGAGNIYIAWARDHLGANFTAISLDSSGNVRWRFEPNIELANAFHHQPVLGDGVLYAALDTSFFFEDSTHRASIFALDLGTGNPAWRWISPNLDTFFDGPAVGHDGYIYHASAANVPRGASGHLYRIRPDGMLDWSVDIGAGVNATPAVDGENNVYLGDMAGIAFKYSAQGAQLWAYDTISGQILASPVLNRSRVTVGSADGLHVVNAETGERDALFAPGTFPMAQVSDRAGNAFFYTFDAAGTVFGFGQRGRQWWSFETGAGVSVNAMAIAANGRLLVGNSETLKAYVAPVLGDLNCDGALNAFDIEPFILALANPTNYAKRYPQCHRSLADINGNGVVNASDLKRFVLLLGRE